MQVWALTSKKSKGFTIVELLIVIVVIAILAAITIVAYNGIQSRAKNSAAQSAASQALKKITLWQVDNANVSPDQTTFNSLVGADAANYQYTQSPNGAFCLTATISNISYKAKETGGVTQGGCPGHDANGAVAVTNLTPNTSLEADTVGIQSIGNASGRTVGRVQVSDAYDGDYVFRITAGSTGQLGGYGSTNAQTLPVGTYVGTMWVRGSSSAISTRSYFEGTSVKANAIDSGSGTAAAGTWKRLSRTFTITTPGTVKVGFLSDGIVNPGDYVEIDGFMLTAGSTIYNFANGNSSNWLWSGTVDGSTSSGLPL